MKIQPTNISIAEEKGEEVTFDLQGRISFDTIDPIYHYILDYAKRLSPQKVVLRFEKTEYFDSAGAAMLIRLRNNLEKDGVSLTIAECPQRVKNMLDIFNFEQRRSPVPKLRIKKMNFFEIFGEFIIHMWHDVLQMILFIGRVTLAMLWNLRHPHKTRWGEVILLIQRAGSEAIPIVGLLSLLIGLVTAFSSSMQLRQFGADIYIADLVGIGMTRELGPLITAIILTGRSGSAFAAEIGTMKISDEIDALTVMGIKPLEYLVLPRILACMLVMPLLTLFADFCGILGGLISSILILKLTITAFMNQLQNAIVFYDIIHGLAKAFIFGVLVAGAGCYRGMETKGGALGVGKSTTSAVVSGIFLIVIADSIAAVLSNYLGV